MNVVQSSRKSSRAIGGVSIKQERNSSAASSIHFYDEIPNFELSLDEFEVMALARLKVLRTIEELKVRNVTGDAFAAQLDAILKANLTSSRIDLASHFILRAAYSRTEDLRRWFLTHECHLLKHRLSRLKGPELAAILSQMNVHPLDREEKERIRDSLLSIPGTTLGDVTSRPYYQIPFTQALDLVSTRQCYVQQGMAYVPDTKVHSIVLAKFRTHLSRSLVLAAAAFHHSVMEESRIAPLLQTMHQQMTLCKNNDASQYSTSTEVSAQTIDRLANHMPLCMRQLHDGLHRDSKLKHWGRLQYGLFLKGAGMSMEDSTLYMQREFTRIMTAEQFQKNYSYNIRHMYGREGKRASYTPYNCKKIILGSQVPGAGDHHGCPYKHYDDHHLASLLTKLQISPRDRGEIVRLAKKEHQPNLACLRHYEVTHPKASSTDGVDMNDVGNHPNAWFAASLSYANAQAGNPKDGAAAGGHIVKNNKDGVDGNVTTVSPEK